MCKRLALDTGEPSPRVDVSTPPCRGIIMFKLRKDIANVIKLYGVKDLLTIKCLSLALIILEVTKMIKIKDRILLRVVSLLATLILVLLAYWLLTFFL